MKKELIQLYSIQKKKVVCFLNGNILKSYFYNLVNSKYKIMESKFNLTFTLAYQYLKIKKKEHIRMHIRLRELRNAK